MKFSVSKTVAAAALAGVLVSAFANATPPRFYNLIEGTPLDFSDKEESAAVKQFKADGINPYNDDAAKIAEGESLFSTACSGCHGHHAEGKLGPGLADDYWTYPANATDPGLFSSIYGGLQGMMGPQSGHLKQDEILIIMSWIRSVYKGDPAKALWKQK
ncbi:MAG: cytochrome c(L), periplasmic [Gammaproteobacteria bacterium]|jgi:cytochrome c-L|nr:cytochrome c(L), periplasmic [Gammaproteobacteria bacterium]MBU0771702.1 cytochrome c(L), periplasmic [Gammaproteobacteria bacterium]MBU0856975.1 cytochrome c(L), periplasmic [Gammaproteobacteria bacterium]MBU1848276.1 cytochrome c(L), periplasmic [Gammaproteobacteria bacterium]